MIIQHRNQNSTICFYIESPVIQVRPKKKKCYVALTRPKFENWVGRSEFFFFFFFFFFLRTVRELSFPIFFFKFLNGENSGWMQSKRIYKSCKCFFKPLNTNFSKFFAQIWHKKKKKKKTWPCFFAFYGRLGEGNITIFFFGLITLLAGSIAGGNTDLHYVFRIWYVGCKKINQSFFFCYTNPVIFFYNDGSDLHQFKIKWQSSGFLECKFD